MVKTPNIKDIGLTDYLETFNKMKVFTENRQQETRDEIWLTEHNPVFTQGQAGKKEHILKKTNIPILQSNRGGQVTYHGPGQIIIYPLINIRKREIAVRQMVSLLENTVITLLANYDIVATTDLKAPGVYVNGKKIASLGLRVRKGCVYHGMALNVNMDLIPFSYINPCGYKGMQVTQLKNLNINKSSTEIGKELVNYLVQIAEL